VKLINNGNITNENIANENITNEDIKANNSHININYILKYEKYEKYETKINISEHIKITHHELKEYIKGNKKYFTISFYNNPQKSNKSNNSYSYSYYLRLYKNKNTIKDEDLNTLAITSSEIYYFNKSIDNNNSEINFTLNDIHNNELYLGYLTIKPRFYTEIYVIYNFTIDIPNKEDDGKNGKNGISLLFIIIIVISSLIIIIIIIIFSIFLMRMKKKNNELEEKLKIFHLE
jgi:ATP-dependent Zn protease